MSYTGKNSYDDEPDSPLNSSFDKSFKENGFLSPIPNSMSAVFFPPLNETDGLTMDGNLSPLDSEFTITNTRNMLKNTSSAKHLNQSQDQYNKSQYSQQSIQIEIPNLSNDNLNRLSEESSINDTIKSIETFSTSISNHISDPNLNDLSEIQEEGDVTMNSFATLRPPAVQSDDDMTPKLQLNSNFNDDTPKIIQSNFDSPSQTSSNSDSPISVSNSFYFDNKSLVAKSPSPTTAGRKSPSLPQQSLSNKFKRLSVTIQQSSAAKSRDSFNFLNAFQQNVNNGLTSPNRNQINTGNFEIRSSQNNSDFSFNYSPERRSYNDDYEDQERPLFFDKSKSFYSQRSDEDKFSDTSYSSSQIPRRNSSRNPSPEKYEQESLYDEDDEYARTEEQYEDEDDDEEDLSSLFIRALHPFESTTLDSEADASICLSFMKNDLAFIHSIDESGWGEVTLINDLSRGWVPMNYFAIAVKEDDAISINSEDDETLPNSPYLKPLFKACGKFLINPLSYKTKRGRYTFSTSCVNSIRDGVRLLLQETDCLSRSNEIVTKRPIVRKIRKSLLADWYKLMTKANDYKGTSDFNKIEILTLMVYEVTRKAVAFLNIWSLESKLIIKRKNEKNLQNDIGSYPLLKTPPMAKQRVSDIHTLLYSYLGLIIGRLDLIEHNPAGCEMLESLTHQIILLLREMLFISKTGSTFSKHKSAQLDNSLDGLLSLVSELVSSVKNLVAKTMNESSEEIAQYIEGKNKNYYYTEEGGNLIQIASKMVRSISRTISSIRKMLDVTGDFKLNSERSYPDYSKIKLDSEIFIRKCSIGIVKTHAIRREDTQHQLSKIVKSSSVRYSIMRSGKTGDLALTPEGANMINSVLPITDSSPFSISNSVFQPFTSDSQDIANSNRTSPIENELVYDAKGNLIGSSFKGLVYTLTDEVSPPEYFFVSTFFLCFRIFGSGIDLVEELITRFDTANSLAGTALRADPSYEVRMKSRRRLIAKMFQIWLESYWKHQVDHPLLSTLMNFFNEGVSEYLPYDANRLIEITSRLSSKPLIENQENDFSSFKSQLVQRSIASAQNRSRKPSMRRNSALSDRYSMVDGYELSKINTNSSTNSLKSMSLPLPLGSGNQTSSSTSLLSRAQISNIEKINLTYRSVLGSSWCNEKLINVKSYIPIELEGMLKNWEIICNQSWVLSNYKPNLLDFNGLEIAKQLTFIESKIFCAIKPEELLNENFSSKRAHLKLSPNINRSFLFTNCLSSYVLESVLQPNASNKQRINTIKNWLKIAISCLYLRNFNSLAAIMTSLQSFLITRLSKLWSSLSTKYKELFDYLSNIIHPNKNYSIYRTKLKNFLVANEYRVPIVPYLSLFLQDLTFIAEGNPSTRKATSFLNQKVINIDKYLKVGRVIGDIETLQVGYFDFASEVEASQSRRNSILSLASSQKNTDEKFTISPLPGLQELILLEIWKVKQVNNKEEDRAWKLSCTIQPRDEN